MFFGQSTTPDLKVADAVYMSMCIPFLFVPLKYNDEYYIDGALSMSIPKYFEPEDTLFIDFDVSKRVYPIKDFNDFFVSVFSMTCPNDDSYQTNHENCLLMRMSNDILNQPVVNLNLNYNHALTRMNCGYSSVLIYLFPLFLPVLHDVIRCTIEVMSECSVH